MVSMRIVNHRLIQGNKGAILVVYLDPQISEFSKELGVSGNDRSLKQEIKKIHRDRYPKIKILAAQIMVGSMLVGSFTLAELTTEASTVSEQTINYTTYKIMSGDTLFKLADRYETSVDRIKEINNFTTDQLFVGQLIKLPVYPYFVVSGDSLSLVAKRFGTSVEEIQALNKLSSDRIYIGQRLLIPEQKVTENDFTYTVVSGDTLSTIAKKYSTTVDKIKQNNNLTTEIIYVGQVLKIPKAATEEPIEETITEPIKNEAYTVQPGDTLYKIATKFNRSVVEIKEHNQLTSDVIYTGQVLQIPMGEVKIEQPPSAQTVYTVVSGDSLSLIAKRFNTTVEAIKAENNLTSDMIYINQRLLIPQAIVEDTTVPSPPTLIAHETLNVTNVERYVIEGQTEANAAVRVKIFSDNDLVLTNETKANDEGSYQVTMDLSVLQDGNLTISATVFDQAGNQSDETTRVVQKDTILPTVSELSTDDVINAQNQFEFVLTGTSQPSTKLKAILSDGERSKSADTVTDSDGRFSIAYDVADLNDGTLTLSTIATDQAGNQSEPYNKTIQKDTVIPENPVIEAESFITLENQNSYLVKGKAQENSMVILQMEDQMGQKNEYKVSVNEDGQFEKKVDVIGYQEGHLFLSAKVRDAVGNQSATITKGIIKDTKAPSTVAITSTDFISAKNQTSYNVYGKAEKHSIVSIEVSDGVTTQSKTIRTGDQAEFESIFDFSAFQEGPIQLSTQVTDQSGNKSPHATHTITKDTKAPGEPKLTVNEYISTENQTTYQVSGVSEPSTALLVTIKDELDQAVLKEVKADEEGVFSVETDLSDLQDGALFLSVVSKDAAGNQSNAAKKQVTLDTVIPVTPLITAPVSINSNNKNNYDISGETEAYSYVKAIVTDGIIHKKLETTTDETGEYSFTVNLSDLKDGPVEIQAVSTDQAGNKSMTGTVQVKKDTLAEAPSITSETIINKEVSKSYALIGKAEPNALVMMSVSDGQNPPLTGTANADENGNYLLNMDVSSLADSVLTVDVSQRDQAGNESITTTLLVKKDTTSADKPELNPMEVITSVNQSEYQISGQAERNAVIYAAFRDQLGNVVYAEKQADTAGVYTVQTDLSNLSEGPYEVEVYQKDEAGNISGSKYDWVQVDTAGPEMVTLDQLNMASTKNAGSYLLSGETEPFGKVSISITDGTHTFLSTTKADDQGDFSATMDISSLSDGPLEVKVSVKDLQGNQGATQIEAIQKDTVAPLPISTEIDPTTIITKQNVTDYQLSGTSDEENGIVDIEVSDGVETVHGTALVSNGTFSIPLNLELLNDGELTASIKVKDQAGNEGERQAFTISKDVTSNVPIVSTSKAINAIEGFLYTVQGLAEPGSTITLQAYGQTGLVNIKKTTTVTEEGTFTIDADLTAIKDQTPFITLKQIDPFGNESTQVITSVTRYVVGSGDTLWKIANQFQTTIDEVIQINNLTSSMIYVGQELTIPSVAGLSMQAISEETAFNMGYLYFGNSKTFTDTVVQTKGTINVVSPTYFDLNSDGTLKLTSVVDRHFIANMQANGVRVVPFLSNHWDQQVANQALENRELLATQIAEAVETYNLDGVNVDIENASPEYQEAYTDFVRLLREKLPEGKEVSAAVGAKVVDTTTGWQAVYDYGSLAPYTDYLMIMSYDESYVGSEPGPIASIGFVESTIQYALEKGVPKEQIVVGIGHYGRYWMEGADRGGFGISNQQVKEAVALYNGTVTFDEKSQSPYATFSINNGDPQMTVYGRTLEPGNYTIWFENEQSIKMKLDLVQKYGIKGTGNWGMAQENPEFWDTFAGWINESEAVMNTNQQ